uniref:Uncharacterized protein n=1 Tax=Timema tahoe TaxID=61484 RepID=A0A7R9IKW7_9NEOP|nr:unnamed protein product [Timema tahoe]
MVAKSFWTGEEQHLCSTLSPVVCSSIPVSWKSTYATGAINYETSLKGNSQSQSPSPKDPLDLTFEDPVASFKSKTTWEVLRAYIVYTICSFDFIVENNTKNTFETPILQSGLACICSTTNNDQPIAPYEY